jgi:hypothetical protein
MHRGSWRGSFATILAEFIAMQQTLTGLPAPAVESIVTTAPVAGESIAAPDSLPKVATAIQPVPEIGGRAGPEPTRFGDWERNGRCIDF